MRTHQCDFLQKKPPDFFLPPSYSPPPLRFLLPSSSSPPPLPVLPPLLPPLRPLPLLPPLPPLLPPHRRLFVQITASLILPLSLLFLFHIHVSHILFSRIHADERALHRAPPDSPSESRLLNLLSSEWSLFLLFKAVCLLFLLIFALLSTSTVVYTVACIFTAKEVTFAKLFTVIPKVWKRLMLTFLWAFLFLLGYNLSATIAIICLILLVGQSPVGVALVVALVSLYIMGLVWISVVWHLCNPFNAFKG